MSLKLTDAEIVKFQKRAKHVATIRGYPELADDFASQIFVWFIEKPDRGATVDQLFIDFLRKAHGRPGTPGGDARVFANSTWISLDQSANEEDDRIRLHERIGCPPDDPKPEFGDGDFAHCFRGRESELYERYFVNQESQVEISKDLGISASRTSQLLKSVKEKIRREAVMQEGRERLEWDKSFLHFSIEWGVI